MKTIFTLLLITIIGSALSSANEAQLNQEIEERIKANKKLTQVFLQGHEQSKMKDKLIPLEKQSGENWTAYLTYVMNSKDLILKKLVLRNEYTEEIIDAYYQLEFEEEADEKILLLAKIGNFKNKLEQLKIVTEQDKVGAPEKKE